MAMIVFAVLGILVLVGTIGTYLWIGGFGPTLATNSVDWANFGSYVGGVAGPLLSFLALMAVVWTVRLQYDLLQRDHDRQLADQHVRWLDALYQDMLGILYAPLGMATGSGVTSLWAVLNEETNPAGANPTIFQARTKELMRLLGQYCEAVALYRDNVTKYFDARIFADRGARILDRIKPFHAIIGSLSPVTLEFLDMNLRGDRQRKEPEAFRRPTRHQE